MQRRLAMVLLIGMAVLMVSCGAVVHHFMRDRLATDFDASLLTRARAFEAVTEEEKNGKIEFDFKPKLAPAFVRGKNPDYFQLWLDDGTPVLRSESLRQPKQDLPVGESYLDEPLFSDLTLPDGRAGRAVQLAFLPGTSDNANANGAGSHEVRAVILVLAVSREPLDAVLSWTLMLIVGAGVFVTCLAVLLVWCTLSAGFRPIRVLADRVQAVDVENLEASIIPRRMPSELAPFVLQVDALRGRLYDALQRERRFTGNVAHELRTPLAELRSLAMVGARWPEDTQSVSGFFEDVGDVASHMEGVIADLLLLARCQAGVESAVRSPTRLEPIIDGVWQKLRDRAKQAGLRMRLELTDDVTVESDPGKLGIVLANVLDNAVSYATPNTEILCVGSRRHGVFELEIANSSAPMSSEDLQHLTQPFWRKDASRSSSSHVGLGLSLVAALAELLHLELRFDADPDGIFRVCLGGWALSDAG